MIKYEIPMTGHLTLFYGGGVDLSHLSAAKMWWLTFDLPQWHSALVSHTQVTEPIRRVTTPV